VPLVGRSCWQGTGDLSHPGEMRGEAMETGDRRDAGQLKGKRVKRVEWWVTTMSAATTRPLYN
jgi:hypothetical protein